MLLVVPLQLEKILLKIVTTIFYMYGELTVNKPLFTLFTSSRPMKRWLESLRKHDVNGSENVIRKCNFMFLQSFLYYSKSLCLQNVLTILKPALQR